MEWMDDGMRVTGSDLSGAPGSYHKGPKKTKAMMKLT